MEWLALVLGPLVAVVLWAFDRFRDFYQRQRVRVLVHQASFRSGTGASVLTTPPDMWTSVPVTGSGDPALSQYYFVKVINRSPKRAIWITHVWFEADPREDIVLPQRPLPARLGPDGDSWEGWVNAAFLAHASNVERSGRIQLANRKKPIRSRPNKKVPPVGYVAGPGSPT